MRHGSIIRPGLSGLVRLVRRRVKDGGMVDDGECEVKGGRYDSTKKQGRISEMCIAPSRPLK